MATFTRSSEVEEVVHYRGQPLRVVSYEQRLPDNAGPVEVELRCIADGPGVPMGRSHEEKLDDAYNQGYTEGYADGHDDGLEEAESLNLDYLTGGFAL